MSVSPLLSSWNWLRHSNTLRLLRRDAWVLISDTVQCVGSWSVLQHCCWVSQCNDDIWRLSSRLLLSAKKYLVKFSCFFMRNRLKLCNSKFFAGYLLSGVLPTKSFTGFLLHLSEGLFLSNTNRNCWHRLPYLRLD
jgi:hypothetical protein